MSFARVCFLFTAASILFAACGKKKKPSMTGDDPVAVSDFIDFFEPVSLPFHFTDSVMQKKESDSLLIGYKVFIQFVPDSILAKVFGKGVKPKIYPLGKTKVDKAETYLFAKIVSQAKRALYILCFDKKGSFVAALPVHRSDLSKSLQRSAVLDKKYTITKTQTRRNADGSTSEGRDVYVLNEEAKNFMLIMTDALEDKVTELVNPIDTLPRKHKLSADYGTGKKNLVSVRDSPKPGRLMFFIHFEKSEDCKGELKGEAVIKSDNLAEYRESGDPCVLQFRFSSSSVTLKEVEGCGSRRPLRCSFDGSFAKKKQVKPAAKK